MKPVILARTDSVSRCGGPMKPASNPSPAPISASELDAALAGSANVADFQAPPARMILSREELDAMIAEAVEFDRSQRMRPANPKSVWLQTFTGRKFYPLSPSAADVCIEDIAAALSKMCRYGGHCTRFYSVAEHSVLVSYLVPPEFAMHGLLHDATEAYLVDVPRPIKPALAGYYEIEQRLWLAIAERFDLDPEGLAATKDADNAILLAERKQLMVPTDEDWGEWTRGYQIPDVRIVGYAPAVAEALFIARLKELKA